MAGRPRAHAADELLLFAEIVHAATTADSLDAHVGLHDLLSEWAHRLATDGASLDFTRIEIESATLPLADRRRPRSARGAGTGSRDRDADHPVDR